MLNVELDVAQTFSIAFHKIITPVGHNTEKIKAPNEVYSKPPE